MVREERKINQIVGIKNNEIWILEDCFKYSDSFKGCTGYHMNIITQDFIDDMNDLDNLIDEYDYLWRDAVAAKQTDLGLEEYIEQCKNECQYYDQLYLGDDNSFRDDTEELIEQLPADKKAIIEQYFGVKDKDYVTWSVSGCGRCFNPDDEWDVIFNPELIELIKEYEAKEAA